MIKVIKAQDAELQDINLAKVEGPNGEKVESNPNFILSLQEDNVQYINSFDNEFNASKKYFVKEGSARVAEAKPVNLNLYQYNGLNYVPSKDKEFKERDYYLDEEGNEVATPKNLGLKEKDPSVKSYYKYTLQYKPNDGSKNVQIASFSGFDAWDNVKALYENCVNNAEEINDVYDVDGIAGVKNFIENNFNDQEYKTKVLLKQQRVGGENSLRRTANRNSAIYNMEQYKAEVNRQILEETGKTVEEYVKDINRGRIPREDINRFNKIAGRKIWYRNGKYIVTGPKVNGRYVGKNPSGSDMYTMEFNSLEDALKGVVIANTIAENLRNNIKGNTTPNERENLFIEANEALHEQLNNNTQHDSYPYIRYEVKDGKDYIIGYYKTLEDAQDAEFGKKLVKKLSGVYFNEENGKFLAIPQNQNNEEELKPENVNHIIRLGEFNSEAEARKAVQVLARLNYNMEEFFESKFYGDHLDECKEARDYYFKENNSLKRKYGIEKSGKRFRIWYYDPELKKTIHVKRSFVNEYQAEGVLKQADASPSYVKFFREYDNDQVKTIGQNNESLRELEKEGIKETKMTEADLTNLINKIDVSDISIEEAQKLLSGDFAGSAGILYIYQNVVNYLKEKLGYSKDDIEHNLVLVFQNKLVEKLINYGLEEFKEIAGEHIEDYTNKVMFAKEGISYLKNDVFNSNMLSDIISARRLGRIKSELEEIYAELTE